MREPPTDFVLCVCVRRQTPSLIDAAAAQPPPLFACAPPPLPPSMCGFYFPLLPTHPPMCRVRERGALPPPLLSLFFRILGKWKEKEGGKRRRRSYLIPSFLPLLPFSLFFPFPISPSIVVLSRYSSVCVLAAGHTATSTFRTWNFPKDFLDSLTSPTRNEDGWIYGPVF